MSGGKKNLRVPILRIQGMSSCQDLWKRYRNIPEGGERQFQVDDLPGWQSVGVLVNDGYRHSGWEIGRFPKWVVMVFNEKEI